MTATMIAPSIRSRSEATVLNADSTAEASRPAAGIDPRELRNTMGHFATGVTVLTYESEGVKYGMTVNSFTSVSMDPPLALVSLMRDSAALPFLLDRPFAINILSEHQLTTALQFAGKEQAGLAIDWVEDGPAPRLKGAAAHLQCTPWSTYDGGDHVLLLGQVESFGRTEDARPLVFHCGKFGVLS
jgi:flavin reductase